MFRLNVTGRGGGCTRRGARGYLLIETMIALMLLGGVVMTGVTFMEAETRDVRISHERFAAALAAESELERLRALPFEQIRVGAGQALAPGAPSMQCLPDAAGELNVVETAPGLKSATVVIRWRPPVGPRTECRLSALFARAMAEPTAARLACSEELPNGRPFPEEAKP